MKEALGLKSKSGVHRLISALVERGFLRRLANRARALEVVKMPERKADEVATLIGARSDAMQQTSLVGGVTLVAVAVAVFALVPRGTDVTAAQH